MTEHRVLAFTELPLEPLIRFKNALGGIACIVAVQSKQIIVEFTTALTALDIRVDIAFRLFVPGIVSALGFVAALRKHFICLRLAFSDVTTGITAEEIRKETIDDVTS